MTDVPVAPAASVAPTIADVSYRNYDGPLRTHAARWWVVALSTIRQNVNRRKFGYWIPAVLIGIVYLFFSIVFYVTFNVRQQIESMGGTMANVPANPYALTLYQCVMGTNLLLFATALTVGSASIAADNRANALLVYLSKPITRADYLFGKWAGVFLLLAALSVLPSFAMYLFFLVAYYGDGFLTTNGSLWWRVIVVSLIAPALHASLIIGFSAWSKTPRLAGATYAAFYFIINILAARVGFILLDRDTGNAPNTTAAIVNSMSVEGVARGIAMNVYDVTPQQVIERFEGGGRRNRRRIRRQIGAAVGANGASNNKKPNTSKPAADPVAQRQRQVEAERSARPAFRTPVRPPLWPVALLGGALIALPIIAARAKVRAVEVIRG